MDDGPCRPLCVVVVGPIRGISPGVAAAEETVVVRRLLVSLLLASSILAASALAATSPLQARAQEVRYAVPATFAYYADHNTFAGMTLAKLRRYDRKIKSVVVRRSSKNRFCLQSTKTPFVHYDGPGGPVRRGRCGTRGAEVPRPGERPPAPSPTAPEQKLRSAVPAIEAYASDNGGYAGMTLAGLQRWDSTVTDIRIVWATRASYCIESGTDPDTSHKAGPGASIEPGPCPPAPA
jgi:hypothetical protein